MGKICLIEIIQEYLQKDSVFVKSQASNLKNEFLNRYFSRICIRIKWKEIRLNHTIGA